MDRGFFLGALDELAGAGDRCLVLTAPAEPVAAPRLASHDAGDEPLVFWDSPAPEPDGRAWSFVGWGEAARVDASGEGRFDDLRRGADVLFASLVERRHRGVEGAPAPRLYGGFAFRPEASRAAPWTAFADASFALPRWLYGTRGDRAFLRLCFPARSSREVIAASIERAFARIERAASGRGAPALRPAGDARLERTSAAAWEEMIRDALACIRARELEKVVPASICKVDAQAALDVAAALATMDARYPECVRFAIQRGEATFLGASPERLLEKRGLAVDVDSLAGTAARRIRSTMGLRPAGPDSAPYPGDDERAARDLFASDKDRREHGVVVDAIRRALAPFADRLSIPEHPSVRTLRNVHHLWTPIRATLARPSHVLDLVRALHPTPAVCGTPREAAIGWIAEHEPAPRGWYTGAVGWLDAAGDGAFSVAIRCGVLVKSEAWLYAGAGIVEGSNPGAEYAETRMKLAPMLTALGIAADPGAGDPRPSVERRLTS